MLIVIFVDNIVRVAGLRNICFSFGTVNDNTTLIIISILIVWKARVTPIQSTGSVSINDLTRIINLLIKFVSTLN